MRTIEDMKLSINSKKRRDARRKKQTAKPIARQLIVNRSKSSRIMVQCATNVNKNAIRRESIDGVEHIVITSMTLPDNIVMNGGLYPAKEIAKSFHTLERTLAPVEHPQDGQGNYISANDPEAIHNYHAGAFNTNVEHIDNRIKIDKFINVQEAKKSDRGKRLLDRIAEIEESDDPRPIHTSVGVWLTVTELEKPKTNALNQKYTWTAKDMVFDHDAILLDSVGAAQPDQGVGMAVNRQGEKTKVQRVEIKDNPDEPVNNEGLSETDRRNAIMEALEAQAIGVTWIEEIFEDKVIFNAGETLFSVPYRIDDVGIVTIVGIPLTVERVVTYTPTTNSEKGDDMKDLIVNALKAAKIETDGLDDDQLIAKYNEMLSANQSGDGNSASNEGADLADVVANALKPVTEKLEGLEAKLNEKDTAEVDRLAGIVANSGKYPGLDADSAKILPFEKLKEMAANCAPAYGINSTMHASSGADEKFSAPVDMPE